MNSDTYMNIAVPKNRKELRAHLHDPLFANAYFLMANTLLSAGSGFFFWIFAARFYTAEDVGLGSAMLSAAGLISILSLFGFDIAFIHYLPKEKEKSAMINSCFTITTLVALLISVVFLLGLNIWAPALVMMRGNIVFAIAFVLLTMVSSLFALQNNVFIAFRKAKYSFVQALVAVLRVGILPLLVAFGAFGIYSSAGLAAFLALAVGNMLIPKVHSSYKPAPVIKKVVNEMMHYSFRNYVANIFFYLPVAVLPLLVVNVLGAEMNAYFYVAWAISGLCL